MADEGYKVANATAPALKAGISALKVVGFLASVFFGMVGYAAFSHGAWVLFVLGTVLIFVLFSKSKQAANPSSADAFKGIAESMTAGVLLVGVIAVVAWAVSGAGSLVSGMNFGGTIKPKTADDCYREHLSRTEAIRTFGSEAGRQRQMDEAVKEAQACGEQALQNRMKK